MFLLLVLRVSLYPLSFLFQGGCTTIRATIGATIGATSKYKIFYTYCNGYNFLFKNLLKYSQARSLILSVYTFVCKM